MIVGISGKRGTGKDTLAKILINNYGFKKLSFAERLKSHVREFFNLTEEQTDGDLKEVVDPRYNKTPRQLMIETGQFYRQYFPDIWIRLAANNLDLNINYVVSDLRFKNEAEYLRSMGAYLVRLDRYPELNIYGPKPINNISETDLDSYTFDHYVSKENNVNISDAEKTAALIAGKVLHV